VVFRRARIQSQGLHPGHKRNSLSEAKIKVPAQLTQFTEFGLLVVERSPVALKADALIEQKSSQVSKWSVAAERWSRAVQKSVVAGAQAITGS
jgi:hypothetical protein